MQSYIACIVYTIMHSIRTNLYIKFHSMRPCGSFQNYVDLLFQIEPLPNRVKSRIVVITKKKIVCFFIILDTKNMYIFSIGS